MSLQFFLSHCRLLPVFANLSLVLLHERRFDVVTRVSRASRSSAFGPDKKQSGGGGVKIKDSLTLGNKGIARPFYCISQ